MINTTRWRPDTCECELLYSWDSDVSEEKRVHSFDKAEKKCEAHADVPDDILWDTIVTENQKKNAVVNAVVEETGILPTDIVFSYDDDRNLQLESEKVDPTTLDTIQATAETAFDDSQNNG